MLLSIVVKCALYVLLNIQLFNTVTAVPASSSGEGSSGHSKDSRKKQYGINDPNTLSILKKNQPVHVQNRINAHVDKGLREAGALNHQYSTQALNVVGITARQGHHDAWSHIFHKDKEVTTAIWDRAHREMSSKKVRLPSESSAKSKEHGEGSGTRPATAADYSKSKSFNLRPNIPKSNPKSEKRRSRSN